jgi:NhaC family Na+:H+ antiporter
LLHRFRLVEAALPLITAAILPIGFVLTGLTQFYWPLGAGALVAVVLAYRSGFALKDLAKGAWGGMKSTLVALSILVLVGGLIGVWKAAGTVPAMVYYGLGLTSPRYLVPVAFVLALATSMMLGTSIGTLSTIGVAIMGVAQGVGAPLPLVAGALVSGALFGDRSSPLSGSLALNVSMTGTEQRQVMTALLPTGVITAALTLCGYLALGLRLPVGTAEAGAGLRDALAAHVVISPWLLVPPVLVLALAFFRVPVRWALGVGMAAGALLAYVVSGMDLLTSSRAWLLGYHAQTGDQALNHMLSGGGVVPMAELVILILVASGFNGIMETTGMMSMIISRLVEDVGRPLALVGSTMLISLLVTLVAANQALAIIVPGRMLQSAYKRAGLSANLLSRALADSGTVLCALIPWNLMGILGAAALGVSVRSYAPYAFLLWLLPLVSLGKTAIDEQRSVVGPAVVSSGKGN